LIDCIFLVFVSPVLKLFGHFDELAEDCTCCVGVSGDTFGARVYPLVVRLQARARVWSCLRCYNHQLLVVRAHVGAFPVHS